MWPQIGEKFTLYWRQLTSVPNAPGPIVGAPPLGCPSAPWSAKKLLLQHKSEYLWIFFKIYFVQKFNPPHLNMYQLSWKNADKNDSTRCRDLVWKYGDIWNTNLGEKIVCDQNNCENIPFYRINNGPDFRPLCRDSHRTHHRGPWKIRKCHDLSSLTLLSKHDVKRRWYISISWHVVKWRYLSSIQRKRPLLSGFGQANLSMWSGLRGHSGGGFPSAKLRSHIDINL